MSNPFFRFSAVLLPYITAFFVLFYLIFFRPHFVMPIAIAVITAWLSAFLLKIIFRRPRPDNKKTKTLFKEEAKFSFPSEHSAIFAALGMFIFFLNNFLGIILLLVAFLIGLARVRIGVHFWRDIITGWSLGIIIALIFI